MTAEDARAHEHTHEERGWHEDLCRVELRANDFDWAGQLNSSVHPQLLETGRWRWSLANGLDLRHSPLVASVVSLRLDYLRPVVWEPVGHVMVRTALETTTAYSLTFQQDIERPDGTALARGTVRLALVDRVTQRPHRVDLSTLRGPHSNGAGV